MKRVDDDTAAEMIADCARMRPYFTNREIWQMCRDRWNVAVSRRQVLVMMQVMRKELGPRQPVDRGGIRLDGNIAAQFGSRIR